MQKISYHVMTHEHKDEVSQCLKKSFLSFEPLTLHLGVNYDEFEGFLSPLLDKAIAQNLSWVAIDDSNGNLVGARVYTSVADDYVPQQLGPKMSIIMQYLEELTYGIDVPAQSIHCQVVGVDAAYRGQGVATSLLKKAILAAKNKGFEFVVGEATSLYTRKILHRIPDLNIQNVLYFEDFEVAGKRPFKGIRVHDAGLAYHFKISDF